MSAGIYITKTGFRLTVWDGEIRQYVDKPIRSILHHLREGCIIEDGVTLEHISVTFDNGYAAPISESDYGGAFDGFTVSSDADGGL